jgi:hypothetical protein
MKNDPIKKVKGQISEIKKKSAKPLAGDTGKFSIEPWKPDILSVCVLLTCILGLHAVLIYVYNFNFDYYNIADRDWGYDNIRYMPSFVQISFYVISLLTIWGLYFLKVRPELKEKIFQLTTPRIMSVIIGLLLIPGSYLLFKAMKIKYFFLGDMNLRIAQTLNKQFINTEYLTMRTLYYFHSKLGEKYKMSMEDIFVQTGYISGSIFVFIAYLISWSLFKTSVHKLLFFLFIISGGYVLVFFGYLEIYALPTLFIILFLLTGILALQNKIHFFFPIVAYALAISFHGFSLIFLPALLYILYKKTPLSKLSLQIIPRWIFLIAGMLAIASFYVLGPLFKFSFFLPLSDELNNKRMLLFSEAHIWEFLNAVILGGGGSFVLLLLIFPVVMLKKDKNDSISNFLLLATFFSIGFIFILDAMRGSGDWDLFAIALIPANVLVPWFLLKGQDFIDKKSVNILLAAAFVFSVFNTSSWIIIQHTDISVKKIKQMLVNDKGSYYVNSFQSEPGLALNFKFNGLMDDAFEMHEISFKKYGTTCGKCVYNYGYDLMNNQQKEKGVEILEYVVATFPFYPYSYLALMNHYAEAQDNENAFRIASLLFTSYRKNRTEFDKNIKPADLKNIFSNLYNYEMYRGNTARCLEISAVLSQINVPN